MTTEIIKKEEPKEEKKEEKEEKPAEEPAEALSQLKAAQETLTKIEAATAALNAKTKEMDEAAASALLAGRGVVQGEPKPLTDQEVANKVMRGELDPLKEDGFI